jgi:hypothetical protein
MRVSDCPASMFRPETFLITPGNILHYFGLMDKTLPDKAGSNEFAPTNSLTSGNWKNISANVLTTNAFCSGWSR